MQQIAFTTCDLNKSPNPLAQGSYCPGPSQVGHLLLGQPHNQGKSPCKQKDRQSKQIGLQAIVTDNTPAGKKDLFAKTIQEPW